LGKHSQGKEKQDYLRFGICSQCEVSGWQKEKCCAVDSNEWDRENEDANAGAKALAVVGPIHACKKIAAKPIVWKTLR